MFSFAASLVLACGLYGFQPTLLDKALDGDPAAIAQLRADGQSGLDELIAHRRALTTSDPRWDTLIDRVAGQRYASHSGLFWYTDLEDAKAAAAATGRGIVSLRLLGRLDEDLSCANSRFFRTMLYPDPAVAAALRKHYVLHWQPVREAPRITIDFGGGKKLVRTITGNSLHYVLNTRGEVVDVMPGLVAPTTFIAWLEAAAPVAKRADTAHRLAHRRAQRAALAAEWRRLTTPRALNGHAEPARASDAQLERMARAYPVSVSREARRLIESLMPTDTAVLGTPGYRPSLAVRAMPIAVGKAAIEGPMLDVLRPVLASLGRDDLKNRFVLRDTILQLTEELEDVTALTAAIYEQVFLTPLDDPWMGLAPTDVFTGLPAEIERVGAR